MYILAIDPGDKHNGVVRLTEDGDLLSASTRDPDGVIVMVKQYVSEEHDQISHVIVERFQMYPTRARAQAWSSFRVVEVIGVIKYLCDEYGVSYAFISPPDANKFWAYRKEDPVMRKQLKTAHEVSAYRIAEMARVLKIG